MFQKNVKPENLDKESLFSLFNNVIDESRTQLTQWIQSAGIRQIEFIINELDKLIPQLLPYAVENFRWRISDKDSESLLYSKPFNYVSIVNIPDFKETYIQGNADVTLIFKPTGERLLRMEVSGESSFLRGYEELGGKNCNNTDLCNTIWNRDYESKYGIRPTNFFMSYGCLRITFELKLNE